MEDTNIKINPTLESILLSIDKDNKYLLDSIINADCMSSDDKLAIGKYLKLLSISGKPSIPLLVREIPDKNFEVEPIEPSMLSEAIQIFLFNKKNLETSKGLITLSNRIKNEGLTEDIVSELSKLTQVDNVQRKFVNIRDTFIDRYENSDFSVGIPIGIKFVDEMVGGIHKGEISTFFGYTGHGKTTLGINAAYNGLLKGMNVLYLSFEVTSENILIDFLSRHSNSSKFKMRIPHYDLKKRKLKPDQWKFVVNELKPDFDKLPGSMYVLDEVDFDSYSQFCFEGKFREIDKLAIKETGHGIDIIVVDHIQLLKFGTSMGKSNSTGDVINEYVSWFRRLSMNWLNTGRQVAFILLSQANRTGYETAKADGGKYSPTALAEANELERASTLILTVFTEAEMKEMGIAKVQVLKYRDSRNEDDPTEVNVDFQYYLFGDIEEGSTEITEELDEDLIDSIGEKSSNSFTDLFNETNLF